MPSASPSATGSVRSTPAASPHGSPSRVRPASALPGPASRAAAPNSLARSLASLHKKVRGSSAATRSGPGQQRDNAPDPRHSLEDVEAAFLAKLQSWMPAAAVGSDQSNPPPPQPQRNGAASQTGSLPAGQRTRRGGVPPAQVPDMQSEEEQIRARARSLAADMAALQHKKRVAFLAEQAAQLRVQSRLQVEERESAMRAQMEKKMIDFRERRVR